MHMKKCSQPASFGNAVLFSAPSQILLLHSLLQKLLRVIFALACIPIAMTAANTMAMISDSETTEYIVSYVGVLLPELMLKIAYFP